MVAGARADGHIESARERPAWREACELRQSPCIISIAGIGQPNFVKNFTSIGPAYGRIVEAFIKKLCHSQN